jgi:hypothetical protein
MTMLNRRRTEREENERLRGWLVYLLYQNRPKPLQLSSIWKLLDQYNQPLIRRRFVEEIDHMRGLGLIRVFPAGATKELDEVEQARLIQRYADAADDREMGMILLAKLTTAGTNFQDGINDIAGVQRVE